MLKLGLGIDEDDALGASIDAPAGDDEDVPPLEEAGDNADDAMEELEVD